MEALTFKPEEWGMSRGNENEDFMFLNLGPNHPSSHGAFRIVLQLDGEELLTACQILGITIAAQKKWVNANHGIATFLTQTVSNSWRLCQ
ncbi:hypothetical protein DOY81_015452 [Sarcophaga bullata]|nr:hypothetical protein DOY81_015452 [Sarcophaga bullata]